MTEKRYIEGVKGFDDYDVWDNESEQGLSHTEVVDLLNEQDKTIKELSEENEQLKKEIEEHKAVINREWNKYLKKHEMI
jgi:predicted RNase H-like nuclease (RuvC/YqgF family)